MKEKKIYTLKNIKDGMDCLQSIPNVKINLHNKKSLDRNTIFSTIYLPLDKAFKIFGDYEIMYPQIISENNVPLIKLGIIVED